jgi:hypothetical protein
MPPEKSQTKDPMVEQVPDGIIEIHDPEIDTAQIMEQIRERIRRRRKELGYPRDKFPTFGAAAYPGEPESGDVDADLYYHLRRANDLYYQIGVESSLAPSPATSLPVVGRLWGLIRREAHNLVLFYLGKSAQQQVAVNRHLVSTLNRMVTQLQQQQVDLRALRDEIKRLRGTSEGSDGR